MGHAVTLIPGDGVGPEVGEAAVALVEATGVRVEWVATTTEFRAAVTRGRAPT